jgi:hypothetical protein
MFFAAVFIFGGIYVLFTWLRMSKQGRQNLRFFRSALFPAQLRNSRQLNKFFDDFNLIGAIAAIILGIVILLVWLW